MKFSVIIPVYNAEKYLHECIASILEQSVPVHEIILVNDGSADSSPAICDFYHNAHPDRIKVIHSDNCGALVARATGIQRSTGNVLVFMDADDRFRQDAIEVLDHVFASVDCDLVIFNGSVREDFSAPFRSYPFAEGTTYSGHSKEALYRVLVSSSTLNNVCLKAASRSIFDFNMDYSSMQRIQHGEDLLMSSQMLTSAQRIRVLDQNLYYYRQHGTSTVHTSQHKRAVSVKTVHLFLESLMEQWDMPWLVPVHSAREVRGWLETFRLAAKELSYKEFLITAKEMADDPYFRRAYATMDARQLSFMNRLFAVLLYGHRYRLCAAIVFARNRQIRSRRGY